MRIGKLTLHGKVLSAPLAGVSNRPFRVLAIKAKAAMTYTEMVSSEGIIRNQPKTMEMMQIRSDEQPVGIQLFGAKPEVMKQAAAITVDKIGPDLIDINFGCPVKKVIGRNGGAAVLKDLALTEDIITATVEGAGETPVTIKIRTGWDESCPVFEQVGQIAEKAGAKAVTLHARSRAKGFSGKADWNAIKKLKDSVSIPVIGNGDVNTCRDALRMLEETGCDAVMVGRAALGNPFIFKAMNHYLETGERPDPPSFDEKIEMALIHASLMAEEFGEQKGVIRMRRYLGWYVKGFRGATELRPKLFQVETIDDMTDLFAEYRRTYT